MLHTCPNCDVTCAQSATQWTASIHTLHTLQTSRNLAVRGGVCTCSMLRCTCCTCSMLRKLHLRTCWMLRNCTCAHVGCYAIALAHMLDATQLHLRTCSMLRNCTCAHVRCYAIALAHMFDATQLHLGTCSMLRNCTWAHVRCYAIALAHMLDATQLHLHTSPRSCPKHISVAYSKWFSKKLQDNSLVITKTCKIILLKPYNPMSSLWDLISITGICQFLPHHHHHHHHQNLHGVITSTVISILTTTLLPICPSSSSSNT